VTPPAPHLSGGAGLFHARTPVLSQYPRPPVPGCRSGPPRARRLEVARLRITGHPRSDHRSSKIPVRVGTVTVPMDTLDILCYHGLMTIILTIAATFIVVTLFVGVPKR